MPGERLQWGRERALAEMFVTINVDGGNYVLQWGRERARARGNASSILAGRFPARCFNGAASARSRKCTYEIRLTDKDRKLQWGRERALAEMRAGWCRAALPSESFNGAGRRAGEMGPAVGASSPTPPLSLGRERA